MKFPLELAAAVLALTVSTAVVGRADTPTVAEQYLLAAVNQERTAAGLTPVRLNPALAQAAERHARQMAAHGSISHRFAGESDLTSRGATAGVHFSLISENVGEAPSAVKIHELWMHSPHHRANLMDPAVNVAGIAVVAVGGELYAVEDFARSVQSVGIEDQEAAIARLVAQSAPVGIDTSDASVDAARRTCTMSTGYAGDRKPWFIMRFTSDSLAALPSQLKTKLASGQYRRATVGACAAPHGDFSAYTIAVLLYP